MQIRLLLCSALMLSCVDSAGIDPAGRADLLHSSLKSSPAISTDASSSDASSSDASSSDASSSDASVGQIHTVRTPPVPLHEQSLQASDAVTPSGAKLISLINQLRAEVKSTRYQGRTEVDRETGYFAWDCSGMAAWMLRRAAPRSLRSIDKGRPVARDFFRVIDRAPVQRARRGWQRLRHISEARPGDVFSWLRSPISTSKVSGHVGFVIGRPKAHESYPNVYVMRVLDATSLPHQDDTRDPEGEGGFGFGTMLFVTDEAGEVQAYGWFGTDSGGLMPAHVIFGRLGSRRS